MAVKPYTKEGKKLFMVEVKIRDSSGKQIYRSRQGISSQRKAEEVEFQLKKEIEAQLNQKPALSWDIWLARCLEKMKYEFQPTTLYIYEKCLNRWVTPHWNSKDINLIRMDDVHELIFEKIPKEVSPHTRKHTLKLIRRVFQMAVNAQILTSNPCSGLSVKAPVNDLKVLNRIEVNKLLTEAKRTNHYFYNVWVFALYTGMRSGEMFAILWDDVDFESCIIRVNKSWNSKNGLKETKSGKNRVIPISDELLKFLKEQKLKANPKVPYVLPRIKEWERGEQARVLRDFCKRVEITPVRFHDLRATFITNLLAQGVSLATVMAIVGHNQIETTNEYLRKAGVETQGATNRLAYEMPDLESGQVVPLRAMYR